MRVSFFFLSLRRPFYSFFDGVVLFRSRGRAGRAVVCWFSGASAIVPSRDRWEPPGGSGEDVVCVVCLSAQMGSFVAGASECRAKREDGLDGQAGNHRRCGTGELESKAGKGTSRN